MHEMFAKLLAPLSPPGSDVRRQTEAAPDSEVVRLLKRGLARVRTNWSGAGGRYCVITGIMTDEPSGSEAAVAAYMVFRRGACLADGQNVGPWNDNPDRTRDEIIAAFTRAIDIAETEGL
jgi:hypothetical protein